MGIIGEFKAFAMRGNVVDMAVGVILGGAFGAIVGSLVTDVMMPPLGVLLGGVDFSDLALTIKDAVPAVEATATAPAVAEVPAVVIKYGVFINAIIKFVIVAFALFMVIKGMNSLKKKEEAAPAPPPGPTKDQQLLTEIRDLLTNRR